MKGVWVKLGLSRPRLQIFRDPAAPRISKISAAAVFFFRLLLHMICYSRGGCNWDPPHDGHMILYCMWVRLVGKWRVPLVGLVAPTCQFMAGSTCRWDPSRMVVGPTCLSGGVCLSTGQCVGPTIMTHGHDTQAKLLRWPIHRT